MNSFQTFSFPNAKNVVVSGDIHGEFNAVIYKLCVQYQMTDTVLIIAGDCGLGSISRDTMTMCTIAIPQD